MDNVSFKSSNTNNINSPQIQQRLDSKENFTALDKEKLKQDTAEFASKEIEKEKNGFFGRMIRNINPNGVKKFLTALGLTLGTVFFGAALANKSSNKMAQLGLKIDDLLLNNKTYQSITDAIKKQKEKIGRFLRKSDTIKDIEETFKNRKAKPRCNAFRGYGQGFVSIFSLTPVDILKTGLKKAGIDEKDPNLIKNAAGKLHALLGENAEKFAEELYDKNSKLSNRELCQKLSGYFKDGKTNQEFLDFLQNMQKGKVPGSELFTNVDMKGGPIGGWWPVNLINSIGKKFNKDFSFCRGNLGDSLVKFNVVDGSLAQTTLGKLTQKSLTVPMESITNFVNDKSGLGFFLGLQIFGMYNNALDAPEGKKIATVADDFVGTLGSIAIATPLAFGATYGLATLGNLKGTTLLSKILKQPGKFFSIGLNKYEGVNTFKPGSKNIIPRGFGLLLRFALIQRVFSPMIQKPIYNFIHKVFGKPYDKNEEEQKRLIEEQKNTLIPELGITQGQLLEKIQSNPQVLEKIQKDPMLQREVASNPKVLVDLLDGKEPEKKPIKLCPANEELLKKAKMNQTAGTQQNNIELNKTEQPTNLAQNNNLNKTAPQTNETNPFDNKTEEKPIDSATYIPSSDFIAKNSISDSKNQELNQAFAKADKVLSKAEQFIR